MLKFFLDKYVHYAVLTYLLAWLCCLVLFFDFWPEWFVWIHGFVGVLMFFYGSAYCIRNWCRGSSELFCKRVFWTAFLIRVCYVLLLYVFYNEYVGVPFEIDKRADSYGYYRVSSFLLRSSIGEIAQQTMDMLGVGFSDTGFVFYLVVINKIVGYSTILMPRILNAVWGALICIFIYQIGRRHFGEIVGRVSAILSMFLFNLIYYCGIHRKEILMLFLLMFFLDRVDKILSQDRISVVQWGVVGLLILVMFTFRTVLGVCAIMALFVTLIMSRQVKGKMMSWAKRLVIIFMALLFSGFSISDSIINEINEVSERGTLANQKANMEWRSKRKDRGEKTSNEFIKYTGAVVFAPMIFTIPFPSVAYTEKQEDIRLMNGGNYVKNILSFFVILTMFAMLMSGEWRNHVLLISFYLGYLCVLVFSNFAHSERFHFLILPLMLLFASKGIVDLKYKSFSLWWLVLMFVAFVAWNWFKLAGRGLV